MVTMLYQANTLMRLARFATNFGVGFLIGLTVHNLFPSFGINITF